MVEYVIDASALVKTFLEEPESAALRTWYGQALAEGASFRSPDLLGYEVASVAADTGSLDTGAEARKAVAGIVTERAFDDVGRYVGTLSGYDASYLVVAVRYGAAIVTYDHELAKAARRHGLETITPV